LTAEVQHAMIVAGQAVIDAKFMRCGSTGIDLTLHSATSTRDPLVLSGHFSTAAVHDMADALTRMATLLDQNKEVTA